MSQPQSHDRISNVLYAAFMICMIGCVVGGFLNNEVAFSIPFYAMLATGAAYVVRRLMLRRRRSQASQNNLA